MHWILRMALPLALFWLVLSGHFDPLFLVLGTFSVVLVCLVSWRAGIVGHEIPSIPLALRLTRYFPWLGKEVLVSALAVVRKVWSPRPALRPVVAATPSPDMTELSQVLYANSITFTPGTLSLDVDEDQIKVHSLEEADVETLRSGRMLRQVQRLEARR
jgi:multicomponent Na+:H+ antiporter subunit E